MNTILENIRVLWPIFSVSWAIVIIGTWWKPQKFRNCFLLMWALFITMFMLAGLFGDYMQTALIIMIILVMIILLLVPIMLIINGIIMIKKESFAFAHVLSLILGVAIAIGELSVIGGLLGTMDYSFFLLFGKWFFFLSTSVIYFSVIILAFVLYMLFIQFVPHRMNYNYIIIHGCGLIHGDKMTKLLSNRCDKAIELFNKHKVKPMIIPSGGKGKDESISEAEAMRRYLNEKGISDEYILMEDQSFTTLENLKYSKKIIESKEGKHKTALVSSNFHVYRCLVYASKLKMKCTGFGAKVAWYFWPSAVLREFVAVFSQKSKVFWILLGYTLFSLLPTFYIYFN